MWPNPQFPEEILNGKLHFLYRVEQGEKINVNTLIQIKVKNDKMTANGVEVIFDIKL